MIIILGSSNYSDPCHSEQDLQSLAEPWGNCSSTTPDALLNNYKSIFELFGYNSQLWWVKIKYTLQDPSINRFEVSSNKSTLFYLFS